MHTKYYILTALLVFNANLAFAKDIPLTARLFVGATKIDPEALNTEMAAQSLKDIDQTTQMGVEATHAVFKNLEYGFRYTKRFEKKEELTDNPATDYYGELSQDSVMFLVRIPFVKTALLRADVFGGVGGNNTTFKIKSATQDGELTRKEGNDWYASTYTAFGGSVAVGFKKLYLVVEGGVESNKVDKFKRSGTINANVNEIDLSGSYVTIGLLFDGLSGKK